MQQVRGGGGDKKKNKQKQKTKEKTVASLRFPIRSSGYWCVRGGKHKKKKRRKTVANFEVSDFIIRVLVDTMRGGGEKKTEEEEKDSNKFSGLRFYHPVTSRYEGKKTTDEEDKANFQVSY